MAFVNYFQSMKKKNLFSYKKRIAEITQWSGYKKWINGWILCLDNVRDIQSKNIWMDGEIDEAYRK